MRDLGFDEFPLAAGLSIRTGELLVTSVLAAAMILITSIEGEAKRASEY